MTRLTFLIAGLVGIAQSSFPQTGANRSSEAWQLEVRGQTAAARAELERAANANPPDAAAIRAYAEFLARYDAPEARQEYKHLAQVLESTGAPAAERAAADRRVAALELAAGDRQSAGKYLEELHATGVAGAAGLSLPVVAAKQDSTYIEIPGPLPAFARMAALSTDMNPQDLLPSLGRNVFTTGYQAVAGTEGLEQTEYLKLVVRYLSQARELSALAGESKVIRIATCDSTATGDLLRVLGYRMRGGCGSDLVLETVNASRAFLTIDSGFPLEQLEQDLRLNQPFTLDYHPARIPLLYDRAYWDTAKGKAEGEFIDYFISDPALCRMYVALAKLDPVTADELRKQIPAPRLKVFAQVLDFFGGMFQIRDGHAVVPGGARSEKAWGDLAGSDPQKGAAFFEKLLTRDDGWLASYYDSLARIDGPVQDYLTDPDRLKRFYTAMRGRVTSPGPARPVFRANTEMLLFTSRLRLDPDRQPHLPGGLDVWKGLFTNFPRGKFDSKLSHAAPTWKEPDDVMEALFGMSRKLATPDNQPLRIFMALSDIDRQRSKPLEAATVDRLARDYRDDSAEYALFADSPEMSDKTILAYLDAIHGINSIHDTALRADTAGTFQALSGLWQIFLRQGSIPAAQADTVMSGVIAPFGKIRSDRELFDAGMGGVKELLKAAHAPAAGSTQDHMVDLVAGEASADSSDAHTQVIQRIIGLFEAQRLISLDTLFQLADNLEGVSRGEKLNTALAGKLATRITEIQLPRESLTQQEQSVLAMGYWVNKHVDAQRRVNLRSAIEKDAQNPEKLKDLRGQLAPFLRDTLVGFNYLRYAPPGEQILSTNPLFVRNHDFIGAEASELTWKKTEVSPSGWPENAGGRLMGSLSDLPYALAQAEQNFLIPSKEQALIWGDLVPQMIITATVPRWWKVTPAQLHWVDWNMIYGESLVEDAALSTARRTQVETELARYAPPGRIYKMDRLLTAGDAPHAIEEILPSELYLMGSRLAAGDKDSALAAAIRRLQSEHAQEVAPETISHLFGSPKPELANSFDPQLLNLRTFPTLMGYSSRILAESWESNLLYYGALADQIQATPADLNVLVPEWTQQTVQTIFATHLEDWPALLRSLRTVGDRVRSEARKEHLPAATDQ